MAFGFPAYANEDLRLGLGQAELREVVRQSLDGLGWRYETPSQNRFVASNSISMSSWGERIRIEVCDDGRVTVRSECVMPMQCVDWGKNRQNVKAFSEAAARAAQQRGAAGGRGAAG